MKNICSNCKGRGYVVARYPVSNVEELLFCHACGGSGHISQEEPMKKNVEITLLALDPYVSACIPDGRHGMLGIAKCRDGDTFERSLGAAIAILKMTECPTLEALDTQLNLAVHFGSNVGKIDIPVALLLRWIGRYRAQIKIAKSDLFEVDLDRRRGFCVHDNRFAVRGQSAIAEKMGRAFLHEEGL
jgi:hypothetical protein